VAQSSERTPIWQSIVLLLIMGGVVGAAYWAIFNYWQPPTPTNNGLAAAGGVVYLIVCYFISPPEPDLDNFTWRDNPFTFSDDISRHRLALAVAMTPGIIIAHSVVIIIQSMRS
jgi:hypothetical protein